MKNIPVDKLVSIIENLPNPERFSNDIFQVPVANLRDNFLLLEDKPITRDDVTVLVFVKTQDRRNWALEIK